jgi:hypothetical protein
LSTLNSKDAISTNYNKLLFHPNFKKIISEISGLKIKLPEITSDNILDFNKFPFPSEGKKLQKIESQEKFDLNAYNGQNICKNKIITGYDESFIEFKGLEGTGYLTSHSLVYHGENDFIPSNFITFYFYTKSKYLCERSKYIKHYEKDIDVEFKKDYIRDRLKFLLTNVPMNSILFVDGPLVGKQMTQQTIELNDELDKNNVIPIFFVKNSDSNLVTDNTKSLKNKYNSDMHWSYKLLKIGQRTSLYNYTDPDSKKKSKMFCYLKPFDVSPIRIEIDVKTYFKNINIMSEIFDLIYYLISVQGDLKNPQLRTIAIAEKYARSTLKLINFVQLMNDLGITPTMNQKRFE